MSLYLGSEKINYINVSFENPDGGINTSDATATANDIASGKTAYVNGEKITGNITTSSGSKIYQLEPSIMEDTNVLLSANPYSQKYIVDDNTSVLLLSPLSNFGDAAPEDVAVGKTFTSASGLVVAGTHQCNVEPEPVFQSKEITPSENQQIVSPDAGYDGLSSVTVGAISSTYIGSGVTRKSAATYNPTESEQTISAGQYLDGAQTISAISSTYVGSGVPTQGAKTVTPSTSVQTAVSSGTYVTGDIKVAAMPNGVLNTPTINTNTGIVTSGISTSGYLDTSTTKTLQLATKGATTITPSTSVQTAIAAGTYATGNIVVEAMANGELSTPNINTSTGVVTAGVSTAGYLDNSATKTLQLTTKSAATIVPGTTDQIIAAGQYLTGTQTIKGDANLIAANIASGVSIFGVTGTHEGNTGIDTSDATATEADIINGKTAYVNGSKVTGTLVVQNYYTGTTTPDSTIGDDGDLYFKVNR